MLTKIRTAALLAVVGAAILAPLYGDPNSGSVSHAEWARMLLRPLDLDDDIPASAAPQQVFSVLSWEDVLSFAAPQYVRGTGVTVAREHQPAVVIAQEAEGEVTYALAVVRKGDYRMRARLSGNPNVAAVAEIVRVGDAQPVTTPWRLVPTPVMTWAETPATHLDAGAYSLTLRLPRGTQLERVEVAPPCISAIEPLGGWKDPAVATGEDVAVTAVKALNAEAELPPAQVPVEVHASDFQVESATGVAALASAPGLEGLWVDGGPQGVRATVFVDIAEAGLYTVSVFGAPGAGGQSWAIDACEKSVLCAPAAPDPTPRWHTLVTAPFAAGRHSLTVNLGQGARVQRVRAERKKASAEDYVATLRRLGFDVGPSGPVPRQRAVEAMNFLDGRDTVMAIAQCGDVIAPGTQPVGLAGVQFAQTPGTSGTPPGGAGIPVPSPSPLPAPSPSPTPEPTPTPTPEPSPTPEPPPPPPPSPSPSPSPAPTPVPTPPPGSPTVITPSPSPGA
ncbi:MAG TPA: hypothetical protein VFM29_00085 [Vicinamibacteria bacterium]|nr:hypothetical protein [Vicinamibacteria bacterium]